MRKVLVFGGMVFVVVLIAMALTKPDDIQHYTKVKAIARSELSRQLADSLKLEEYAAAVSVVVMGKVNTYVDSHLRVRDCVFFTLGIMNYQGMSVPATLGVFNHVLFIVDEDKVRKAVTKKVKIPKIDIEELKELKEQLKK